MVRSSFMRRFVEIGQCFPAYLRTGAVIECNDEDAGTSTPSNGQR